MKYYDDLFDKEYLDSIAKVLANRIPWFVNNVANKYSFPSGQYGSHLLMGQTLYNNTWTPGGFTNKEGSISYDMTETLMDAYYYLCEYTQNIQDIEEIAINLQFKGMEGSLHTDGRKDQNVFILMLSNDVMEGIDGGGFFYEPSGELVPYRYGRVVQLEGSSLHRGEAFTVPNKARISVKFMGAGKK
jgi:virulence-associated protein VapD